MQHSINFANAKRQQQYGQKTTLVYCIIFFFSFAKFPLYFVLSYISAEVMGFLRYQGFMIKSVLSLRPNFYITLPRQDLVLYLLFHFSLCSQTHLSLAVLYTVLPSPLCMACNPGQIFIYFLICRPLYTFSLHRRSRFTDLFCLPSSFHVVDFWL